MSKKIWGRVDPKGKETLKHLDQVQRTARDRGTESLPKETTRKIIDRVVKPVKM